MGMNRVKRKRVQIDCPQSLTHQSFKEEVDVNNIVKRFRNINGTDLMSYQGTFGGHFGDFSGVTDYQTALEQVHRAEEAFSSLPAKVRKQFDNDPAQFLDFCGDPANKKEMQELGLLEQTSQQGDSAKIVQNSSQEKESEKAELA